MTPPKDHWTENGKKYWFSEPAKCLYCAKPLLVCEGIIQDQCPHCYAYQLLDT